MSIEEELSTSNIKKDHDNNEKLEKELNNYKNGKI